MSHWKTLSSKSLYQTGIFRLREDKCELPDGRVMPRYFVFEFPDWVNVVPITPDGKMILIRQHRHAAGQDFLEIPGGSTHPGAGGEDPRDAGARELLEETGYASEHWILCGSHFPNPALQSNKMHTYLALDCVVVQQQQLDEFEDIEVVLMDVAEVVKLWREGGFTHSLIAASIGVSLKELERLGFC